MLESAIQSECVKWFRLNYRPYARLLYKNDNEGQRSPHRAACAIAMGLVSGIPDMFLAVPTKKYHGAYFEFKQPGGKLSGRQHELIEQLRQQGYFVEVISSLDGFTESLDAYFVRNTENDI